MFMVGFDFDTVDYGPWQKWKELLISVKKSKNISQREENCPDFSFIAPRKVQLLQKTRIPLERTSQVELNGTNFISVAPSSEEL